VQLLAIGSRIGSQDSKGTLNINVNDDYSNVCSADNGELGTENDMVVS